MDISRLAGLALTALEDNMTPLDRPYKLTFSITYSASPLHSLQHMEEQPNGELDLREMRNSQRATRISGG